MAAGSMDCFPKILLSWRTARNRTLTYFTSDPFELSVAVVLDIGIADVASRRSTRPIQFFGWRLQSLR